MLVNMYAFRATNPKELLLAADPVGPDNDEYIARAFHMCGGSLVAGYGSHPMAHKREQDIFDLMDAQDVLYCLGRTKEGMPRHPLYVRADHPLEEYAKWA